MNYKIIYDNPDEDIITRLLKIRNVDCDIEKFLDPKLSNYRLDPFLLNDMEKAVERIILAMKKNEKIMIFGDYDVDGVTASYILYKFINKYLDYKNISIQYPDRIKDGYGLKKHHLDDILSKNVKLIITVDNGITSVNEANYAKELGIDLIITDHHQNLDKIPDAFAVINPKISPDYLFKGLAGVGVSFKLICALLSKSKFDQEKKNKIFNYFLPIVAIGTVADVVPLVDENRVIVKRGLEMINNYRDKIPSSLKGLLDHLNIQQKIDTFHIGFLIGPRINAGGRMKSPYDSLNSLLYSGEQQLPYLKILEDINTERKSLQDTLFKYAESQIDFDKKFLISCDEIFHEGIIGIVSGKLTEKYNKPSMVMKVDKERNMATASLRGPDYFDVIEMIKSAAHLLMRFGGHKGAGGLSVALENLDKLIEHFDDYCEKSINDDDLVKITSVDTKLYDNERNDDLLDKINKFAPFGEGNEEPTFLIEDLNIEKIEKVGSAKRTHFKIHAKHGDKKLSVLFWGKGEDMSAQNIALDSKVNLVGKVKKDTYNGGWYFEGIEIV